MRLDDLGGSVDSVSHNFQVYYSVSRLPELLSKDWVA